MNTIMKKIFVMMIAFAMMLTGLGMGVDVKAEENGSVTIPTVETEIVVPEVPTVETDVVVPEIPTVENTKYVAVYSVKPRSKASMKKKSKKLGTLKWKDMVVVTGTKGKYTQIDFNGKTAYVKTVYLTDTLPVVNYAESPYTMYTKKKAKIYKAPSIYSAKNGKFKKNKEVSCVGTIGQFTAVKKGDKEVFVKTSYLTDTKPVKKHKEKVPSSGKGSSAAHYALKFKGNPYKWGGTSLTHGADCSGFTMSVFRHFGIKLPHSSSAQRRYGKAVSLKHAKAGDLVCYSGHVGIYIGGGKIVHASTPRGGIKVSSVHIMKIKSIRRLL